MLLGGFTGIESIKMLHCDVARRHTQEQKHMKMSHCREDASQEQSCMNMLHRLEASQEQWSMKMLHSHLLGYFTRIETYENVTL